MSPATPPPTCWAALKANILDSIRGHGQMKAAFTLRWQRPVRCRWSAGESHLRIRKCDSKVPTWSKQNNRRTPGRCHKLPPPVYEGLKQRRFRGETRVYLGSGFSLFQQPLRPDPSDASTPRRGFLEAFGGHSAKQRPIVEWRSGGREPGVAGRCCFRRVEVWPASRPPALLTDSPYPTLLHLHPSTVESRASSADVRGRG